HFVGVHHGGMLPGERLFEEKLLASRLLSVLIGTSATQMGLNSPIPTVIIPSLLEFDGQRMIQMSLRTFWQAAGRAGRPGFDARGEVYVQADGYGITGNIMRGRNAPRRERWNHETFRRLVDGKLEPLVPRFRVTQNLLLDLLATDPAGGYQRLV